MMANMKAAGIDPAKIDTILISHFHPDHIFGLMEKGTNEPVFPNAEIIVSDVEYKFWTDPTCSTSCPRRARVWRGASRRCSRPGRTSARSPASPKSRQASALSTRPGTRPAIARSISRRVRASS